MKQGTWTNEKYTTARKLKFKKKCKYFRVVAKCMHLFVFSFVIDAGSFEAYYPFQWNNTVIRNITSE